MKIEHNSQLEIYRSPFGAVTCGTPVTIRIAASDAGIPSAVLLHYRFNEEQYSLNMAYVFNVGDYCFYSAEITMPQTAGLFLYYFEFICDSGKIYYGNNHQCLGGTGEEYDNIPDKLYQITVYDENYKTPDWFKNSVVYQIFPDRFFNGNENGEFCGERNDIIKRRWGDTPFYKQEQFGGEYKSNDFFGGNLKGITKKLDYLKELGIGAIYLNPIFKAYSNHKYDTGDYMQIDESFGTLDDFRTLCKEAENRNIKIILDGVFNHTGSNSVYFNKNGEYHSVGAYQSQQSPYSDWYNFKNWPNEYDAWWGTKTLPAVNENSESFRKFILNSDDAVVKHWLKQGASGWRLDVVDELPDFFVKDLRTAVKNTDPDAVIIGEVWEDASNKISYGKLREYFLGSELDSVMNYPLRQALIDLSKNNIDAAEFNKRIMSLKENYPAPAYYSLLNILSSHDVERILTAISSAPDKNSVNRDFMADFRLDQDSYSDAAKKLKQIVMLQMLLPGVPCIYYGDEIGIQGYNDPFCRQCFCWDNINEELKSWYALAIRIRKSSDAFTGGAFETVYAFNYGYCFIRFNKNDKYAVCANFGRDTEWFRLDLARFGIKSIQNEICNECFSSPDGIFYIPMTSGDIKVFKCTKD